MGYIAKAYHKAQSEHIVKSLHNSKLFNEMDRVHLEQIAEVTTSTEPFGHLYKDGTEICKEGQNDDHMYPATPTLPTPLQQHTCMRFILN